MRRVTAVLALLWCLPNLMVAFWMVRGAFIAKTAMKEGLAAQAALLLGGLLIGILALLLARRAPPMLAAP